MAVHLNFLLLRINKVELTRFKRTNTIDAHNAYLSTISQALANKPCAAKAFAADSLTSYKKDTKDEDIFGHIFYLNLNYHLVFFIYK
jgi:hypothetical protein